MTAKEITEILTLSQRLGLKAILIGYYKNREFGVLIDWDEWEIVDDYIYYEYDYFLKVEEIKGIRIK